MTESPSTPTVQGTRTVYAGYPPVHLDFVRFGDGSAGRYIRIDFGTSAQILAVNDRREILFIEGYRHGLGRVGLRLPAGGAERGERPDQAARRELLEETGYAAKEFRRILKLNSIPGYTQGWMHVFLARGLRRVRTEIDHREADRVVFLPVEDAIAKIGRGEIVAAAAVATLSYAALKKLL